MKLRHRLALNVTPAIARLILAATFLWFGFGKLQTIEYTGEDAQILIKLGVGQLSPNTGTGKTGSNPALPPGSDALPDESRSDVTSPVGGILRLQDAVASTALALQDETDNTQPAKEAVNGGEGDAGAATGNEKNTTATAPVTKDKVNVASNATVTAYRFHMITLMLYRAGNTHPVALARMALIMETVGGILILIGLFTRLWGLGLAIVMCYAFFLTTWVALLGIVNDPAMQGLTLLYHAITSIAKLNFNAQISAFHQLSLFGLAMIVVVSGPGSLSLDYLIFRPRTKTVVDSLDEEP